MPHPLLIGAVVRSGYAVIAAPSFPPATAAAEAGAAAAVSFLSGSTAAKRASPGSLSPRRRWLALPRLASPAETRPPALPSSRRPPSFPLSTVVLCRHSRLGLHQHQHHRRAAVFLLPPQQHRTGRTVSSTRSLPPPSPPSFFFLPRDHLIFFSPLRSCREGLHTHTVSHSQSARQPTSQSSPAFRRLPFHRMESE